MASIKNRGITANVNVQLLEELGEEEKHFGRKLLEQVRAPLKGWNLNSLENDKTSPSDLK